MKLKIPYIALFALLIVACGSDDDGTSSYNEFSCSVNKGGKKVTQKVVAPGKYESTTTMELNAKYAVRTVKVEFLGADSRNENFCDSLKETLSGLDAGSFKCANGNVSYSITISSNVVGSIQDIADEMLDNCDMLETSQGELLPSDIDEEEFSSSSKKAVASSSSKEKPKSSSSEAKSSSSSEKMKVSSSSEEKAESSSAEEESSSSSEKVKVSSSSEEKPKSSSVEEILSSSSEMEVETSSSEVESPVSSSAEESSASEANSSSGNRHTGKFEDEDYGPKKIVKDENTLFYDDFGGNILCLQDSESYILDYDMKDSMPSGKLELYFRLHEDFLKDENVKYSGININIIGNYESHFRLYYEIRKETRRDSILYKAVVLSMDSGDDTHYEKKIMDLSFDWTYARIEWIDGVAKLFLNNKEILNVDVGYGYLPFRRHLVDNRLALGFTHQGSVGNGSRMDMYAAADYGPIKLSKLER